VESHWPTWDLKFWIILYMENMAINRAQRCGFCILVYLKIKKGREKRKRKIDHRKQTEGLFDTCTTLIECSFPRSSSEVRGPCMCRLNAKASPICYRVFEASILCYRSCIACVSFFCLSLFNLVFKFIINF
jgi:hypothetical protein